VDGDGCHVFEESKVKEVTEDPLTVHVNDKRVHCEYIIIATHVPLMGINGLVSATFLQSKLAQYTSYVVGGAVPRRALPEAVFWDTADPYQYLRIDVGNECDYAIFGGQDHKTGQSDDTEDRFRRLEQSARELLPEIVLDHRWSGQVIETNDGLPYIGETAEGQFVATGFGGNGMTFGTLAGIMARDAALRGQNPWRDLFHTGRTHVRGGMWSYVTENADFPYYFVKDRVTQVNGSATNEVKRGEGKILSLPEGRVACFRDDGGKITMVSPVCTHLGCLVHWNSSERTWDCPCHGSRFKPDGKVLAGPAESPLEPVGKPVMASLPKGNWGSS
jgi:nitrite reductase/ring-hydroxylating ferredoxin subunit